MPCSIRDVSRAGARLEVEEGAGWVVSAIDVRDVMTGVTRKGVVVWREGPRLGIRFIDQGAWPKAQQAPARAAFGRRSA